MSSSVPASASFELKSRNVSYRERRTVSIQPSTGSGSYGGSTGRQDIKFNLPASHMLEPRGCYLRFKTQLTVKAGGTAIDDDFAALLDGSAASVIERLTVKTGNGEILEDVENVDQLALFHIRSKPESWRYEQGRQLMGFCPKIDEALGVEIDTVKAADEAHAVLSSTATVAAGASLSRTFEWCIPMCMISGLFASDKVMPLKYMNRSGGPALTIELKLRDKQYAMRVQTLSTGAAVGNLDTDGTGYQLNSVEFVEEELVPTAVYDQALAQAVEDSGPDGLKMFYRSRAGYSLSTGPSGGTEFTINAPLYSFSIGDIVAWWRPSATPAFETVNVSKWASGGVTRAQSSFGSYTMPTSGVEFENPANQASVHRKNNARGLIELSKVVGKVCGEGSTGFKKWEQSAELVAQTTTDAVDDAYHRVYAFNYDTIDNQLQDPSSTISGIDNRSSSLPAVVRFNRESAAPFDGSYTVQMYICDDRLISIDAARGVRAGVTA